MSEAKAKPKVVHKEHSGSGLPIILIVFSLGCVALGVLGFLNIWLAPKLALEIVLVVAGLWLLFVGMKEASGHERRSILKKFI